MILVKEHLDFKLISSKIDPLGRYIFLEVEIQDSPFVLLNVYAPNKCAEQCDFFSKYRKNLRRFPLNVRAVAAKIKLPKKYLPHSHILRTHKKNLSILLIPG